MNYLNTLKEFLNMSQSLVDYINSLSGIKKETSISDEELQTFVNTICPDDETFKNVVIYIDGLNRLEDPFKSVVAMHLTALHSIDKYKIAIEKIIKLSSKGSISSEWDEYCRENYIKEPNKWDMP